MKKRKILVAIICILLATIFCIIGLVLNHQKEENPVKPNTVTVEDYLTIKSTEEKPIIKDGIEVTLVDIKKDSVGNFLVSVTLKNISDQIINDFYIEVDLLDVNGNIYTSLTEQVTKTLSFREEYYFEYSIPQITSFPDIADARIGVLEKKA